MELLKNEQATYLVDNEIALCNFRSMHMAIYSQLGTSLM